MLMALNAWFSFKTVRLAFAGTVLAIATLSGAQVHAQGLSRDMTPGVTGVVALADLPPGGREMFKAIGDGGPFRHDKDGSTFGNRERLLPAERRGHYREYTVDTPGSRDRGARRIVCGGAQRPPAACWYTADHYASFRRIVP